MTSARFWTGSRKPVTKPVQFAIGRPRPGSPAPRSARTEPLAFLHSLHKPFSPNRVRPRHQALQMQRRDAAVIRRPTDTTQDCGVEVAGSLAHTCSCSAACARGRVRCCRREVEHCFCWCLQQRVVLEVRGVTVSCAGERVPPGGKDDGKQACDRQALFFAEDLQSQKPAGNCPV